MSSPGTILTAQILAAHGAHPDVRLWRNEVGVFWAGEPVGRSKAGHLVLAHATRVTAGLCPGSADLIGIGPGGRFLAIEVKAGKDRLSDVQRRWLAMVAQLGGLAIEARSVEDVTRMLEGL